MGPRVTGPGALVCPVDASVSGFAQYRTEIVFGTSGQRMAPGPYALLRRSFRRVSTNRERSARLVTLPIKSTAPGPLRTTGWSATRSARTYYPSHVNAVMTQGYANINSRA